MSETRDRDQASPKGPPPMPRWVKVSIAIAVALVALFVVLKLTGAGGEHGPGRHGGPSGLGHPAEVTGLRDSGPLNRWR